MTTTVPLIGITAHEGLVGDRAGIEVLHHVANVTYAKAVRKAGGDAGAAPAHESRATRRPTSTTSTACWSPAATTSIPSSTARHHAPRPRRPIPRATTSKLRWSAAAVAGDAPLLCICRGIQVMNVALGGTLQQHYDGHFDVDRYNERVHDVVLEPGSLLAKIMGAPTVAVNSLHHQALDTIATDARGHRPERRRPRRRRRSRRPTVRARRAVASRDAAPQGRAPRAVRSAGIGGRGRALVLPGADVVDDLVLDTAR